MLEMLPNTDAMLIAAVGVFLGTLAQRLAGQGFGMVSAPVVAIVAPEFLPATLLVLGVLVGITSAAVDFSAIRRKDLPWGFSGRALGAFIAAGLASLLIGSAGFAVVVALLVYLGIFLSLIGIRAPIRDYTLFTAGVLAGIMGTLTAVGAPPMALLYQHEVQRVSAAMQNTFFFFGMVVSILSLAFVGLVRAEHLIFAVVLAPVVIVGLWVAQPLARRVAKARIRPWALGLAGLAASFLLLRQFT